MLAHCTVIILGILSIRNNAGIKFWHKDITILNSVHPAWLVIALSSYRLSVAVTNLVAGLNVGLDILFFFLCLLFYSCILKQFTYYSFQKTYYSFQKTYYSF